MPGSEPNSHAGLRVVELDGGEPCFAARWQAVLESTAAAFGYCQTPDWAMLDLAANGHPSFAIALERNGDPVAGALFALTGDDVTSFNFGMRSLQCLEGPVLPEVETSTMLRPLLDAAGRLRRRLGASEIRFVNPPANAPWLGDGAVRSAFARCGYTEEEWATVLVDLTQDDDTLRRGFRRAARKGIRKCSEAGVRVGMCQSEEEFLRDFSEPYIVASRIQSPDPVRRRHRLMWRMAAGRSHRFFVARADDGTTLATLGTYACNAMVTEIMSSRSEAADFRKLPAQDLLHWEIFRAHRAAGDRAFNLAGFNPAPTSAKEDGIRRFKCKWSEDLIALPSWQRRSRFSLSRAFAGARASLQSLGRTAAAGIQ